MNVLKYVRWTVGRSNHQAQGPSPSLPMPTAWPLVTPPQRVTQFRTTEKSNNAANTHLLSYRLGVCVLLSISLLSMNVAFVKSQTPVVAEILYTQYQQIISQLAAIDRTLITEDGDIIADFTDLEFIMRGVNTTNEGIRQQLIKANNRLGELDDSLVPSVISVLREVNTVESSIQNIVNDISSVVDLINTFISGTQITEARLTNTRLNTLITTNQQGFEEVTSALSTFRSEIPALVRGVIAETSFDLNMAAGAGGNLDGDFCQVDGFPAEFTCAGFEAVEFNGLVTLTPA